MFKPNKYVTYIGQKYEIVGVHKYIKGRLDDDIFSLKKCFSNEPEIKVSENILYTDDSYKDSVAIHDGDLAYNIYNEKVGIVKLKNSGEYTLHDVESLKTIYHGYEINSLYRLDTKPKFAQGEYVQWLGVPGLKVKESNSYASKIIVGDDEIWVKNDNLSIANDDENDDDCATSNSTPKKEEVNHPARYNRYKKEVIDVMKDVSTHEEFMGFLKNTIIKYLSRYQDKGGTQDLKKADWYLQRMIEEQEEEENEEN